MEFGVLGPVEVRHQGRSLPTGSARERYVLAALLLDADRLVTTERLVDALWRTPPVSAKAQLHNMISKIRSRFRGIDDELIATRSSGYQLRLRTHRLDLIDFRGYVEQARHAVDHRETVATLGRGFALWRGPALADIGDDIAAGARRTLGEERLAAGELRLDAQLALGGYAEVLAELAELLAEHPYREHLYRRQMLALAGAGRRADALAAYRQAYRRLVDDLGVEPGVQLRELEQQILRGESPPYPGAGPLSPRQLPPVNAPVTGRDELLAEIAGQLAPRDDATLPVVVLVGPGGVGKTTLALTSGHRLADRYPGGQLYADLRGSHARPADPYRVVGRFLRALGVPGAAVPEDSEERIAMYRSHLAGGATLVVLDDAADEQQLRPLLPGSARCAVVVTSRRQLAALLGAARITVPQLVREDAVTLLARISGPDRAAAEPDAATRIVEICGGLPLAVSIAAARLASHPGWRLDGYAARLAAERGRLDELVIGDLDVRASIALSYHGLSPDAARLFRQLGALPTPDWPGWVPYALAGGRAALDQLVDVHLVEPVGSDAVGQRRYRLHDLVAAYATELGQDAESELWDARRVVLDGWLGLAAVADDLLGSSNPSPQQPPVGLLQPGQPPVPVVELVRAAPLDWFDTERVSLLDAIDLSCRLADETADPELARTTAELAGRLAIRLTPFLAQRSYDEERDAVLDQAVTCVRRHGDDGLLARLLTAGFEAAGQRDRRAELPGIAREALAAARRAGDRGLQLRALSQAARAARMRGQVDDAVRLLQEAVVAASEPGTPDKVRAATLDALASTYAESSRPAPALPLYREALALFREQGQHRRVAQTLSAYGNALIDLGQLAEADVLLAEAHEITERIGDAVGSAYVQLTMVDADLLRGRWTEAAARIQRSLSELERLENQSGIAAALRSLGDLEVLRGRPAGAVPPLERSLGIWREIDMPVEVARVLSRLGHAYRELGDPATAGTYQGRLDKLLAELALEPESLRLPAFLLSGTRVAGGRAQSRGGADAY